MERSSALNCWKNEIRENECYLVSRNHFYTTQSMLSIFFNQDEIPLKIFFYKSTFSSHLFRQLWNDCYTVMSSLLLIIITVVIFIFFEQTFFLNELFLNRHYILLDQSLINWRRHTHKEITAESLWNDLRITVGWRKCHLNSEMVLEITARWVSVYFLMSI